MDGDFRLINYVDRHSYRLIILSFLVFLISIVNFGCAQAPIEQSSVEYDVWSGVTASAKTDAETAVNETIDFFKITYGINLNRHIKVVLVSNDSAYEMALIKETGVSELEAKRRARISAAWSTGHTIIRNTAKANDKLNNVFKISHEVVHQYQEQETGGAGMQIEWFTEGMADVIAAHVVDRAKLMPLGQFKLTAKNTINAANKTPMLAELHLPDAWGRALETYGVAVTYRSADMAVLILAEKYGLPSLMDFLRNLRKTGMLSVAFQKNFLVNIETFEQQYDDYLHSITRKAS